MQTALIWAVVSGSLMPLAGTAGAVVFTPYSDKPAWESAVGGTCESEGFADSTLNDGVSFVSSESGHVNPSLECYQDVLASTSQNEPMTIWSFALPITAYGGNWTLGGPGGSGNSLQVYIDGDAYAGSISNSYGGEFWGFTADTPFTSVKLVGGSGIHQQHYSLDDMVYAYVPEPAAAGFVGLAMLLACASRRARGGHAVA